MSDILRISITAPPKSGSLHCRKFYCIGIGISTIIGFCPRNIPITKVVALQGKFDMLHIYRAFHLCRGKSRFQFLNTTLDRIFRVFNSIRFVRILRIETSFCCLHRVKSSATAFLHHNRLDKFYILRNAVLFGILLYDGFIGFYLCTYRSIGVTVTSTTEHCYGSTEQHDNHNNQHRYPTSCGDCCYKCFCPCNNRFDCRNSSFRCRFDGICCGFRRFLCRLSRFLCCFGCCFCCFLCYNGSFFGGLNRSLCRLFCGLDRPLNSIGCTFRYGLDCRISCRPCRLFNCFLRTLQSSDALFSDRIDRLFLKLFLCTLGLEILNSRFGFLIILPCFTHTPSADFIRTVCSFVNSPIRCRFDFIGSIFLCGIFRSIGRMFCLIFRHHIGFLHSLRGNCCLIYGLDCTFACISCFYISHRFPPFSKNNREWGLIHSLSDNNKPAIVS